MIPCHAPPKEGIYSLSISMFVTFKPDTSTPSNGADCLCKRFWLSNIHYPKLYGP